MSRLFNEKEYFKEEIFTKNMDKGDDWDMAMCYNLRLKNIFMWMMNMEIWRLCGI